MPSANKVWATILLNNGYKEHSLFQKCENCYTLEMFCKDNKIGKYVCCDGSHVCYVEDGNWYDSWNSKDINPIYYFAKEDENSE